MMRTSCLTQCLSNEVPDLNLRVSQTSAYDLLLFFTFEPYTNDFNPFFRFSSESKIWALSWYIFASPLPDLLDVGMAVAPTNQLKQESVLYRTLLYCIYLFNIYLFHVAVCSLPFGASKERKQSWGLWSLVWARAKLFCPIIIDAVPL